VTTTSSGAATTVTEPAGEPAKAAPPSPLVRAARAWWLPPAVVALVTVVLLIAFETPPLEIAQYAGYVAYGLTLPGTLLWRALRGTPRSFLEDVAAGTVLGYAVELFTYFIVSALGVPALVAAWPAVVIVAFLAIPRLRQHWHRTGAAPLPLAWSWAVAGITLALICWIAWSGFLSHALDGPTAASPYVDMPWHMALAGELKHHFPPKMPYVVGEPLSYHWFVHAHLAASSWTSGLELNVLLYRFYALPLAVLSVVLIAILAARVSGRLWAGPVAAGLTVFVGSFHPYAWTWGSAPLIELNLFTLHIWGSPTQSFGLVLFLPVILLLADRLRGAPGGRGQWAMLTLLIAATMGGKATFLPLLLAGVGFAGLIGLITRRRIERPLLITAGLALAAFAYAQRVLFGGVAADMKFDLLAASELLASWHVVAPPRWFVYFMTGLILLAWAGRAVGLIGILGRRERWSDPMAGVLAGVAIGAIVVALSFHHSGGGQLYFARSMFPFLAILSAWGAATLIPPERVSRWLTVALLGSAALGGITMAATIVLGRQTSPKAGPLNRREVAFALLQPYLVIGAVVAVFAVALYLARRRLPALRGVSLALVVALMLGLGLARLVPAVRNPIEYVGKHGGLAYTKLDSGRPIAEGAVAAGRWLREHSDTDDLVATNVHCRTEYMGQCDSRHFWIAAYAERHVLVEGWSYTPTSTSLIATHKGPWYYVPFWRERILADNDRAFSDPTSANVGLLRERYGVRWLFVDERFNRPPADLGTVARERFRAGDSVVYEIPS
jgi:hypothetical protein